MTTDVGSKWPTLSDREFARQVRWSVPRDFSFHRRKRPKLLSPFGWCTILGVAAVVIGAGLAFAM
ncbi:MAG TPA: hypothetical protein VNX86_00810 [Rhizomicrobium sp.]|jgi:hypothetical protein|nr:hypothetical protein [Rhizomicrobium sp.]